MNKTDLLRIIRWLCVAVVVWGMRRIQIAATTAEQCRSPVEMDCARQGDTIAATSRTGPRANVISIVSLVVAVASALFTYYQVELTRDQVSVARDALELTREQADAARDTLQQATTIEDLRFVGKLSVSLDKFDGSIKIANFSDFPLTGSLVWTLGIAEEVNGDTRLVRQP